MKKSITILLVLSFSLLSSQIPTNGLIAYYPFNNNANDLSGNSINGTIVNATPTTDRFGNPNSAYYFNGTSTYLKIPNNPVKIDFTNSFAVSFWINVDSLNDGNRQNVLSVRQNNNASDLGSWDFNFIKDTVYSTFSGKIKFLTKRRYWEHIAFTYDKPTKTLTSYNNGLITGKDIITANPSNSSPIQIGATMYNDGNTSSPNTLWRFFKGKLDDFVFYNRVLSPNEVTILYRDGFCIQKIEVSDTLKISSVTGFNDLPLNFGTVKIYPNPTMDILNIFFDNPSANYTIKITDNLGSVIDSKTLNQPNHQIDLKGLSKGIYIIQILNLSNNVVETKKLVLE